MTTEKMRNYTVSYNLNMEYIDKVVKQAIKMNTGSNKKIKYSFIEKIQPLLKDLADPNKPIDVKAWTERRDGNGNPINPLTNYYTISDTLKPIAESIAFIPLDKNCFITKV